MIYVAYIFALVLVLISLFAVLVILMQRPSANAGMGSALAGGAAESVFGGGTAETLNKITYALISLFFLVSFGLYLAFLVDGKSRNKGSGALDVLAKPAATTPATPAVSPPPPPPSPSVPAAGDSMPVGAPEQPSQDAESTALPPQPGTQPVPATQPPSSTPSEPSPEPKPETSLATTIGASTETH